MTPQHGLSAKVGRDRSTDIVVVTFSLPRLSVLAYDAIILCRLLRQGMHDLKVWVGVEADGSSVSTTPGKTSGELDEMSRVAKVALHSVIQTVAIYYL